ncbi:hypothetical protein B9J78_04705 [bacterium Unc6]|nr:hypothetical protein [bacterium Unc6]
MLTVSGALYCQDIDTQVPELLGLKIIPADFSGNCTITLTTQDQKISLKIAKLGDNIRTEMDLTKISGLDAATVAEIKELGLNETVVIIRQDKKLFWVLYPSKKGYIEISQEQINIIPKDIEYTKIAEETLNGVVCDKYKISTKSDKQEIKAYYWLSKSQPSVPIRSEVETSDGKIVIEFSDIKLISPAKELFEVPSDYKKYTDPMQMLMGELNIK